MVIVLCCFADVLALFQMWKAILSCMYQNTNISMWKAFGLVGVNALRVSSQGYAKYVYKYDPLVWEVHSPSCVPTQLQEEAFRRCCSFQGKASES